MRRSLLAHTLRLTVTLAAAASGLRAQDTLPVAGGLAPGARVRVIVDRPVRGAVVAGVSRQRTERQVVVGALASHDSAGLLIQRGERGPARVPLALVSRLEVSRGRRFCTGPARRLGCMVLGTGGGLLLGGYTGAAIGRASESESCGECYEELGGAVVGALVGGVTGLLVGSFVGGERWRQVPLAAVR